MSFCEVRISKKLDCVMKLRYTQKKTRPRQNKPLYSYQNLADDRVQIRDFTSKVRTFRLPKGRKCLY